MPPAKGGGMEINMNNRKIVFFDIDGTIYRFDTGMPKDTYEAIKLLKAYSIGYVFFL